MNGLLTGIWVLNLKLSDLFICPYDIYTTKRQELNCLKNVLRDAKSAYFFAADFYLVDYKMDTKQMTIVCLFISAIILFICNLKSKEGYQNVLVGDAVLGAFLDQTDAVLAQPEFLTTDGYQQGGAIFDMKEAVYAQDELEKEFDENAIPEQSITVKGAY